MERSNRETIERLGGIEVHTIPLLPSGLPADLAPAAKPYL